MNQSITDRYEKTAATIERISRFERALLSTRYTPDAAPSVLNTTIRINYQEITRLRAELDAALGFDHDLVYDLALTLSGPKGVALGLVPLSVVAGILNDVRLAVQTVAAYLAIGRTPQRGPLPKWIRQAADLSVSEMSAGSVRIGLNIPSEFALSHPYGCEYVERSIRMILYTISWICSDATLEDFLSQVDDIVLHKLLLSETRRLIPNRDSIVECIQFSGRLVDANHAHMLEHPFVHKIDAALGRISLAESAMTEDV